MSNNRKKGLSTTPTQYEVKNNTISGRTQGLTPTVQRQTPVKSATFGQLGLTAKSNVTPVGGFNVAGYNSMDPALTLNKAVSDLQKENNAKNVSEAYKQINAFGDKLFKRQNTTTQLPTPQNSGNTAAKAGGSGNLSSQLQAIYQNQLNASNTAVNNLQNQLDAQRNQYQDQLRAMQLAQQQAAQNAYNNNLAALQDAYNSRLSGLGANFDNTKDLLGSSYENSRQNLNSNAEKALQEAYINRMMGEKNMSRQLNAQGLNGGAAESTIASLLNNYGNARNNIELSKDNSLRELEQNYNNNLAQAQQRYSDALNDAVNANMAYRMQLENDLNNNVLGSYQNMYNAFSNLDSDYANAMYNLLMKQANDSADIQSAMYKNAMKNANVSSDVNVTGGSTGNIVNDVKKMRDSGMSFEQIMDNLTDYSDEQVAQIFAEAGFAL